VGDLSVLWIQKDDETMSWGPESCGVQESLSGIHRG
jgi:hypothetical protein